MGFTLGADAQIFREGGQPSRYHRAQGPKVAARLFTGTILPEATARERS
jgi:hypothetical protein